MTTAIAPKYNVGDTFYVADTETERRKLDCPDCLGKREFAVTAPSGDTFTMECPRCSGSYSLRDVPSLEYYHHVPRVRSDVIVGYCVNEWGEEGVSYRGKGGCHVKEHALITDEAVALRNAELLAASRNAEKEAEPQRIHLKRLGGLPLKEATINKFQSGLYDSWSAYRNLREAVDGVIENEAHDFGDRDTIVSHLEDHVSQSQRYEFIFKGFTRAMEAVVALVNADAESEAEILANLRGQWAGLPEGLRATWEPPSKRVATSWDGEPCPTY